MGLQFEVCNLRLKSYAGHSYSYLNIAEDSLQDFFLHVQLGHQLGYLQDPITAPALRAVTLPLGVCTVVCAEDFSQQSRYLASINPIGMT